MLTTDQISQAIDAAETSLREKKYAEAYGTVGPLLVSLKRGEVPEGKFFVAILLQLSSLLGGLNDNEDDGGEQYKSAQRARAQLLRDLDTREAEGSSQDKLTQFVLDKALSWYPEDPKVLNEQAWFYYDRDQYDKSLHTFEHVINGNVPADRTERLSALRGAGASLRRLRRFGEAEDCFKEAVALFGDAPVGILIERGWLNFYREDYELARGDFEMAQAHPDADDGDKRRAMTGQIASRQAEDAEREESKADKAKELLDQWLTEENLSTSEAVDILFDCGTVHSRLNKYRAAVLAYALVLEKDSRSRRAYELKIEALKWLRLYRDAKDLYDTARKECPNSVEIWNEMGNTLYRQKRYREALDFFTGEAVNRRAPGTNAEKAAFKKAVQESAYAAEWTIVVLRKMRRLPEAEKKVNETLARFPDNINVLSERAVVHFERNEYVTAIEIFDRALAIDEYDEFANQWRVACFRKQRKFEEAEQQVEKALRKLPAASGLWEERAWISFDQNDLKKADEYFAESIKLDPYLIQRQFSRVEVLARLNFNEEALRVFENLEKQFPGDVEVAEQFGWFHLRQGRLKQAKEKFESILKADPANVVGTNGEGGYYLELREYQNAETAFRSAIEKVKREPQYRINLAWALIRQVRELGEIPPEECTTQAKLLDDAAASCRNALENDPYNAKAYICLGVIAFKQHFPLDAEAYFLKSHDLDPAAGSLTELGALYVQMGRYDDAKKALANAIALNNNDARAHIEMANLLLSSDSANEAVRECRYAVSVAPNSVETYHALGIALMRAGQYEEAQNMLYHAIMRVGASRQWQLHLVLSEILVRLGDDNDRDRGLYAEALKHINQARRNRPNADVFFHSGIVQYRLEEYKSARNDFKDCLNANRDRFEAERFGKVAKSMMRGKRTSQLHVWGGMGMAAFCGVMLVVLWSVYFSGWKRDVLAAESTDSTSKTNQTEKAVGAQSAGTPGITGTPATKGTPGTTGRNRTKANPKITGTTKIPGTSGSADAAAPEPGIKPPAEVESTRMTAKPKQELVVDSSMLTMMTPLLLGLLVVGLVLPNLTKLKLFSTFEAEISEVKPKEISSGPKGDIGFGSSLSIISPGPGGR